MDFDSIVALCKLNKLKKKEKNKFLLEDVGMEEKYESRFCFILFIVF